MSELPLIQLSYLIKPAVTETVTIPGAYTSFCVVHLYLFTSDSETPRQDIVLDHKLPPGTE